MKMTTTLATAASLFISSMAVALEKPEYQILYEDDRIEYRLYDPYTVAETSVELTRSYNKASNEGFRRLLGYITGNNISNENIEMTAPVQMSEADSGEKIAMTDPVQTEIVKSDLQIAFMLPAKFSIATAPVPNDERVSLRRIPSRLMAVIRYSGRWTESNRSRYESRLREHISEAGIEILSGAESAAYNPPFTPPFMRRNEIMIEVAAHPRSDS